MSFTESLGRIQQIQSTLASFEAPVAARAAVSTAGRGTASSSSNASAFADTLAATLAAGSSGSSGSAAGVASAGSGTTGAALSTGATAPVGSLGTVATLAGAPSVGSSGVSGEQIAAAAKKYVGVPYVWGGTDPRKGMDCSGFVQRVFGDVGIDLPRVVSTQMKHGTPVASMAQAKVGDLLISHGGKHISIYLGDGKAIDAPMPGKTIQVRDAWEMRSNLYAIRRIVPDAAATPGVGAVRATAATAPTAATAATGPATAKLDASQRRYAQIIVDEVRARGLPAQAAVNAVSTALQESSLRMYWNPKVPGSRELTPDASARGSDGYSVGLFQQQVHGNHFSWGTVADAMDPRVSTRMFLDRLTKVPGWQNMSVASADQAVQRSAFPNAYAKWEHTARQIVSELSKSAA